MALLQEWFGYCLSADTSLQKAMIFVGKKRSGKGTICSVLQELIGSGNWCAFSLSDLSTSFGLSELVNKAVAVVGEVELAGHPQKNMIVERLKSIIGEDAQPINRKFEPVQTVKLPVRFSIATNAIPALFDASGALGERFL